MCQTDKCSFLKHPPPVQDDKIRVRPQQHRFGPTHNGGAGESAAGLAIHACCPSLHLVQTLLQTNNIRLQDLLAALFQRQLQVIIANDFDELLAQPVYHHALGYSLHHFEWINMRADILQQWRNKFGLAKTVANQNFPQVLILLRLTDIPRKSVP